VSEANLEPERLAKPISRAEHQRAIGVMVRSEGSRQSPPPTGGSTDVSKEFSQKTTPRFSKEKRGVVLKKTYFLFS
jgi:hypothetical protein